MKKVFAIVLALALVMTGVVASVVPAGAVTPPITVCLENPIAKQVSDYCIMFHNGSVLKAADDDFIDIIFPFGTNASTATGYAVWKSPAGFPPPAPCSECVCPSTSGFFAAWELESPVSVSPQKVSDTTVRLTLNGSGQYIDKCEFVLVEVYGVTNPTPCEHHLEVGTSTHTPVDSDPYTIYCAKIALKGGVDPITGLAKMNLISLPCYPIDTSIEVVLARLFLMQTITASDPQPFTFSVWYWDNTAKKWLKYVSDSSFTDLKTIEPGKSYWVKPSRDIDIYIHGYYYIAGQGPPVKWCYPECWNMVGFACNNAAGMSAKEYIAAAKIPPTYIDAVIAIWTWSVTPPGHYVDTGYTPGTTGTDATLYPGVGYWMAFIGEACIIPPSDCDC